MNTRYNQEIVIGGFDPNAIYWLVRAGSEKEAVHLVMQKAGHIQVGMFGWLQATTIKVEPLMLHFDTESWHYTDTYRVFVKYEVISREQYERAIAGRIANVDFEAMLLHVMRNLPEQYRLWACRDDNLLCKWWEQQAANIKAKGAV